MSLAVSIRRERLSLVAIAAYSLTASSLLADEQRQQQVQQHEKLQEEARQEQRQERQRGRFVPLFPKDGVPSGWHVRRWDDVSKPVDDPGAWKVVDGVLVGRRPRGTWLISEGEYGDLELEFEFKLGSLGNSGLALRAPPRGDPAFDGLELQMADKRYNTAAKDSELTGGLYRAVAPRKQVYRPTEWNHYELLLRGDRLRVRLNGELIHDLDLDEQDAVVQRHDGSDAPPIKDRPRRGHIGFQNLSRGDDDVLIRNARIRVLDRPQ